jgi:hypothetical protein
MCSFEPNRKQPMKYSSVTEGIYIFSLPISSSNESMYVVTVLVCSMCLKLSVNPKLVSAANLLLIKTANSAQLMQLVLMLELISEWSAFPMKKTYANLTLLSNGVSASVKQFSTYLSHPSGLSPSNLGNSIFRLLLND